MTTFIRGQQGLIDMIIARRNRLEARLVNNDNPNNLQVNRMKRKERDETQGEIYGLNMVLSDLIGTTVLPEAQYDEWFGANSTTSTSVGRRSQTEPTPRARCSTAKCADHGLIGCPNCHGEPSAPMLAANDAQRES